MGNTYEIIWVLSQLHETDLPIMVGPFLRLTKNIRTQKTVFPRPK